MAQRKKIQQENMRASLPRRFWRQFEESNQFASPFITAISKAKIETQLIH